MYCIHTYIAQNVGGMLPKNILARKHVRLAALHNNYTLWDIKLWQIGCEMHQSFGSPKFCAI